jgi:hypothetical protein
MKLKTPFYGTHASSMRFPVKSLLLFFALPIAAMLINSCQKNEVTPKDGNNAAAASSAGSQMGLLFESCCKTWLKSTASDGKLTIVDTQTGNNLEIPDNLFDLSNTPSQGGDFCILSCTEASNPSSPQSAVKINWRDNLMAAWRELETWKSSPPPTPPNQFYFSLQNIYSSYMSASTMSNKTDVACLAFQLATQGTNAPQFRFTDPVGLVTYLSKNNYFRKLTPSQAFYYAQQGQIIFMAYVNLDVNVANGYQSRVDIVDGTYAYLQQMFWYDGSSINAFPLIGVSSHNVGSCYPVPIQSKIVFYGYGN